MQSIVLDIETTGLDPTIDRIVCIGVKNDDVELVFMDRDEPEILKQFWAWMDSKEVMPTLVGYNTEAFDIPFLVFRTLVRRMKPHWLPHLMSTDLMLKLFPNGARYRSKDAVCAALGIGQENALTGADVPRLFEEGKLEDIKAHCLDDVRREWELYKRMRDAGLF